MQVTCNLCLCCEQNRGSIACRRQRCCLPASLSLPVSVCVRSAPLTELHLTSLLSFWAGFCSLPARLSLSLASVCLTN